MTFYEQQCAVGSLGGGLNLCSFCLKGRQLSEALKQSIMIMAQLKDAEKLAESLQETIDAKDEQIKFLSEYIKSGGTKIFEDC